MMKYLIALILLFHPIAIDDGVMRIGFDNGARADTVIAFTDECAFLYAVDPSEPQQLIQFPPGPPFAERCLVQAADQVWLLRFRGGVFLDRLGPYTVRSHILLPMVGRT